MADLQFQNSGREPNDFFPLGCRVSGAARDNEIVVTGRPFTGNTGQIDGLTFTAPGDAATFSVRLAFSDAYELVEITTDADATAAEAAIALADAVASNVNLKRFISSVISVSEAVAITWRRGVAGTVTIVANPGTALALVTQAATDGPQFRYGQVVELVSEDFGPGRIEQSLFRTPAAGGTGIFGIVVGEGHLEEPTTYGVTPVGPRPGQPLSVIQAGSAATYVAELGGGSPALGGPVYVGIGDESGGVFTASGSGRILWPNVTFKRTGGIAGSAHIKL